MMHQIQRILSYICMFQFIFQNFGTLAGKIFINPNTTELLENNHTSLTCTFINEKDEQFISVEIIAKNLTDNFADQNPIAIFNKKISQLHPSGEYLSGRVTLTEIRDMSTDVTLTFHKLKCTDEKDYICKYIFFDMVGKVSSNKSAPSRLLVKVPVREININNQPNQRQYDIKTDNITLTCKANGDPEPKYIWYKDNKNDTIISRTNSFVIENIIRNKSGVYICEAHNIINNVTYTQKKFVEIDIVEELLPSTKSASSKSSAVHAAYTVPLILAIGCIGILLAVKKKRSDSTKVERNKESFWQNHKKTYTPVAHKINTASDVESGGNSNGIKENNSSFRNNEVNPEKTVDTRQNKPSSIAIYAVPSDTVPEGIDKDRGKNEDHGVLDQDAVYSEVFNQANMKSEMSKAISSVPLDNVDHNCDGVCVDQCHV